MLNYFIIDKSISDAAKPPKNLNDFQTFYNAITSSDVQAPSFFPKKILVVCNKKSFKNEVRRLGFESKIPYGEIVNSDNLSLRFSHLIDTPIIIASDYHIAKQFVDENPHYEYKYLIVSGGNEISKIKALVKNDCNRNKFENCIIFGSFSLIKDNTFILWHWNRHEEAFLSGEKLLRFHASDVLDSDAMTPIQCHLDNTIRNWIDEGNIYPHIKHVFRFILKSLGNKLNNNEDVDENLNQCYDNMLNDLAFENYDESDCEEHLKSIISDLRQLHDAKLPKNDILQYMVNNMKDIENIVVPNGEKKAWDNILNHAQVQLATIIEEKEFQKRIKKKEAFGKYLVTYVPRSGKLRKTINSIQSREVSIKHLLYAPEDVVLRKRIRFITNMERRSESPKDGKLLKKYSEVTVNNDIFDSLRPSIDRFEQFNMYDYYIDVSNQSIAYEYMVIEVKDADGNIEEKKISKKVLIRQDQDSEVEIASVDELEEGQLVYLYENNSKIYLYDILSRESKTFIEIEEYAKMWKYRLAHYLKDDFNSEKLITLSNVIGIDNPQYIERHWLHDNASIKFPQTNIFRKLISFLKLNDLINDEEEQKLMRLKKVYAGAMISLGSNLSSEIQKIFREGDGDTIGYIRKHVLKNDSEFKVLSKFDDNTIFLLVLYNMKVWTFVRVVREEEDDER